jgi:hypothetical protein
LYKSVQIYTYTRIYMCGYTYVYSVYKYTHTDTHARIYIPVVPSLQIRFSASSSYKSQLFIFTNTDTHTHAHTHTHARTHKQVAFRAARAASRADFRGVQNKGAWVMGMIKRRLRRAEKIVKKKRSRALVGQRGEEDAKMTGVSESDDDDGSNDQSLSGDVDLYGSEELKGTQ